MLAVHGAHARSLSPLLICQKLVIYSVARLPAGDPVGGKSDFEWRWIYR